MFNAFSMIVRRENNPLLNRVEMNKRIIDFSITMYKMSTLDFAVSKSRSSNHGGNL